jgi:predicted dehydrogenase
MTRQFTRRRFLQTGSAAALSASLLTAQPKTPVASERLRVGIIGVAGKGESNWQAVAAAGAEIAAICDVDESRLDKINTAHPQAAFYADFRKLIEAKGIDAVVVSTPDHMHAPPSLMALRAGLHVFCEKPLTHTVAEARLVAETAAKHKRVTQMGTQIHAGDNYRRVVELIQSGAIGKVSEVHTWVPTTYHGNGKRPKEDPIPKTLHWDLWLGTGLNRPCSLAKANRGTSGMVDGYVPFSWRGYWAFGGGALNDMACHHMDLPFWALKLRHPIRVSATGSPPTEETCSEWTIVEYEFPGVKLTWYDGGKQPRLLTDLKMKWGAGNLFVGDKGMLLADYSRRLLLPEDKFKGFQPPAPTIPNSVGHYKEWVEACKTGKPTTCNFDYSGALAECVLLGTVSYRSGKPFEWDAAGMKTKGAPEAQQFLTKEYRNGWELG